jgi:hypothetical protein
MFSLRKLPADCEVRGHCKCKEMPVIPVNRVVDKEILIRKMEGQQGGEEQGVADRPPPPKKKVTMILTVLCANTYYYVCNYRGSIDVFQNSDPVNN